MYLSYLHYERVKFQAFSLLAMGEKKIKTTINWISCVIGINDYAFRKFIVQCDIAETQTTGY